MPKDRWYLPVKHADAADEAYNEFLSDESMAGWVPGTVRLLIGELGGISGCWIQSGSLHFKAHIGDGGIEGFQEVDCYPEKLYIGEALLIYHYDDDGNIIKAGSVYSSR